MVKRMTDEEIMFDDSAAPSVENAEENSIDIEEQITTHTTLMNQILAMIEENKREIALNNDVEGRTRMLQILTKELQNHTDAIEDLAKQMD